MSKVESAIETPVPASATDNSSTAQRRRWPIPSWLVRSAILALIVIIAAGFAIWWYMPPQLHGQLLQATNPATDFTLMTTNGKPMSLSSFRGKVVLLYFGYTYCPDVCPTTLSDLARTMTILGDKKSAKVQVLFVTVDPQRDTVQQLAAYLRAFNPSFLGMRGSLDEIHAVASQYGIYFQRREGTTKDNYTVDHTSAITLIDRKGYVRMIFSYGTAANDMASDLSYFVRR